jgi:hypothetical protein
MAWITRLFTRNYDGGDVPEPPEDEFLSDDEPRRRKQKDDAFDPRQAQATLLARVRRDAEADAIRHAEDMLERDFPIVAEAERIAETRLAALKAAFAERRAAIQGRIEGLAQAIVVAETQLRATEGALAEEGVPPSRLALAPRRGRPAVGTKIAIGLAGAVAIGLAIRLLELSGPLVLPLAGAAMVLLALALALQPGPPLEDADITSLREVRVAEAEALTELRVELEQGRRELGGFEERALGLAETEVAFASQLVGAYQSAAFSSLPVGTLEDGRGLKEQRTPSVKLPAWARELAAPA